MLDPKNLKPGQEQYETFERKEVWYQYDYRDFNGKLYSAVGKTLFEAKKKVEKDLEGYYNK